MILTFWIAIALIVAVWVGTKVHSKAGTRIAIAGMFTLGAYICVMRPPSWAIDFGHQMARK